MQHTHQRALWHMCALWHMLEHTLHLHLRALGPSGLSQGLGDWCAAVTCMAPLASCPCLVPPRVASWAAAWARSPCVVDAAAANTLLQLQHSGKGFHTNSAPPRKELQV